MRKNEQHRVERVDGRPSFFHAAARLLASDRRPRVRDARTVLRQVETAEASRLRANREASAARTPDASSTGGTPTSTAR